MCLHFYDYIFFSEELWISMISLPFMYLSWVSTCLDFPFLFSFLCVCFSFCIIYNNISLHPPTFLRGRSQTAGLWAFPSFLVGLHNDVLIKDQLLIWWWSHNHRWKSPISYWCHSTIHYLCDAGVNKPTALPVV